MKLHFKADSTRISAKAETESIHKILKHALLEQLEQVEIDYNLPTIPLVYRPNLRGHCELNRDEAITKYRTKIVLPDWILDRNAEYAMCYLLHECAHAILHARFNHSGKHDATFARAETELTTKYRGIIPLYAKRRGYAIGFIDKNTNELLFDGHGWRPTSSFSQMTIEGRIPW